MDTTLVPNSNDWAPVTAPSYHPDSFTGDDGTKTLRPYWTHGSATGYFEPEHAVYSESAGFDALDGRSVELLTHRPRTGRNGHHVGYALDVCRIKNADFRRQVLEHRDHSDDPQWHDLVDYCRCRSWSRAICWSCSARCWACWRRCFSSSW